MSVLFRPGTVAARFVSLCRLDADTGCWVWRGQVNKQQKLLFRPGYGEPLRSALKWSWQLFVGALDSRRLVTRLTTCDRMCVCPWHLVSKQPRPKRARLRDGHKFSREVIAEVRASRRPGKEIARAYGMSESQVSKIRNGHAHADVVHGLAVEPPDEKRRRLREEFLAANRAVLDSLIKQARKQN